MKRSVRMTAAAGLVGLGLGLGVGLALAEKARRPEPATPLAVAIDAMGEQRGHQLVVDAPPPLRGFVPIDPRAPRDVSLTADIIRAACATACEGGVICRHLRNRHPREVEERRWADFGACEAQCEFTLGVYGSQP